jgi:hypothetical protein
MQSFRNATKLEAQFESPVNVFLNGLRGIDLCPVPATVEEKEDLFSRALLRNISWFTYLVPFCN